MRPFFSRPTEKEMAQQLLWLRGRTFTFGKRYFLMMFLTIGFFIYLPFSLVEFTSSNVMMYVGGMTIGFVVSNRFWMYVAGQMVRWSDPFIDWDKVEACAADENK